MKKFFKYLAVCLSVCLLTLVVSACSKGGKMTKEQWDNAFNYAGKVVVNTQVSGGSIITYFDGNKVKIETGMGSNNQTTYMDFDGTKYWQYNYNSATEKWSKNEIVQYEYEDSTTHVGKKLHYDNFAYDKQAKLYFATNVTIDDEEYSSVLVSFSDGRVAKIECVKNEKTTTITFNYEAQVTVVLPEVITESSGEEGGEEEQAPTITEEEWNNALGFVGETKYVLTSVGNMTIYKDGNKCRYVVVSEGVEYTYYFEENGQEYYLYSYNYELEKWEKELITKADYDAYLGRYFATIFPYSLFKFDATKQAYTANDIIASDSIIDWAEIYIDNQKVTQIKTQEHNEEGQWELNVLIDYSGIFDEFELPVVLAE